MPKLRRAAKLNIVRVRNIANISVLTRHSHRSESKKSSAGLTRYGVDKARGHGERLPKGYFLALYSSEEPRAHSTAKYSRSGYKSKKQKVKRQTRIRKELFDAKGLNKCWPKMKRLFEEIAKRRKVSLARAESIVMKEWLLGKRPKFVPPFETVADQIIRKRIRLGEKITRWEGQNFSFQNILLESISHSWPMEAVFTRLTGRISKDVLQGKFIRETGSIVIYHTRDGEIILSRSGEFFDITNNVKKILGK